MRRILPTLVVLAGLALFAGSTAAAKRSGVKGVVTAASCASLSSPCPYPTKSTVAYTAQITIQVRRARDGELVSSTATQDGRFRIPLRRGLYDVSAIAPGYPPCPPNAVCAAGSSAVIAPCTQGDTERVRVRRHRFTQVELQVQNVCAASAN